MLFGSDASTWQYDAEYARIYDFTVEAVCDRLQDVYDLQVANPHFPRLEVRDRIGHLRYEAALYISRRLGSWVAGIIPHPGHAPYSQYRQCASL